MDRLFNRLERVGGEDFIKALILAGGKGTRLKPLTGLIKKPLLMVGNKTCIEWVIENLRKNGIEDIEVTSYDPFGSAHSLLEFEWTEPTLVCNGDTITNVNIKEMLKSYKDVEAVIFTKDNYVHNGGTYIFSRSVRDKISPITDIPQLLERLESFALYDHPDSYYYDIGTFEKLKKARQFFESLSSLQ